MNPNTFKNWKVEKDGLYWEWTRPVTAEELQGYRLLPDDDRSMSLLGLSRDDLAVITDPDAAALVDAAPRLLLLTQLELELCMHPPIEAFSQLMNASGYTGPHSFVDHFRWILKQKRAAVAKATRAEV